MRRTRWAAPAAAILLAPAAVVGAAVVRTHLRARRAIATTSPMGGTIVVFGALALAHGPGQILRARLDHALDLYRRGCAQRIAMAGGIPPDPDALAGGHDEVAAMIAYARAHDVPEEDLLEVRPGQNTREQVSSVRRRVIDAGLGPVIAVSSSYHLPRIVDEARRQGFDVLASAPAHSPDVDRPRLYLSHLFADALGSLWYALPPAVIARVDTSAGSFRHVGVMMLTGDASWRDALASVVRQSPSPE